MRVFLVLCLILVQMTALSQPSKPDGRFLSDSVRIGETIPFSLSVQYPVENELVFPDSNFNYAPFEFVRKEFFPSQADSSIIKDSVIYHLTTFEIDLVQRLKLPVFVLSKEDSIPYYSEPDSIYLNEMVPTLPDTIALREDVALMPVNKAFNYPYLFIGLGIVVVILTIIYFFFGKRIRQELQLYRLQRAYKKFTYDFDQLFNDLRKSGDKKRTEQLLVLWKKYMENLEDRPYTKLTSREIASLNDAGPFHEALKSIDRGIYGDNDIDRTFRDFETLEDVTGERYLTKVKEIKNG